MVVQQNRWQHGKQKTQIELSDRIAVHFVMHIRKFPQQKKKQQRDVLCVRIRRIRSAKRVQRAEYKLEYGRNCY